MVLTGGNFIPVTCWPADLSAVGLLASWIITVEEWFFWLMEMKFERRGEVDGESGEVDGESDELWMVKRWFGHREFLMLD